MPGSYKAFCKNTNKGIKKIMNVIFLTYNNKNKNLFKKRYKIDILSSWCLFFIVVNYS